MVYRMDANNKSKHGSEYKKGLIIDAVAYLCAFGVGAVPFAFIGNIFAAVAAFTAAATLVIFVVSVVFKDVSIYDPYWSVAPPVMLLAAMIKYGLWNVNAIIIFALVLLWAFRLTANWLLTYKGLGHEDWRYAKYRKEYNPFVFQLISFVGLQYVPTIVVYAGLTGGLFAAQQSAFAPLSVIGIVVMMCAVLLAFLADSAIHKVDHILFAEEILFAVEKHRAPLIVVRRDAAAEGDRHVLKAESIHKFLREHKGQGKTCNISVWRYSRHPNYLGEMSFWTGMYFYFVAVCPGIWYKGLGFLSIIALFLTVSIPMMEKHNMARRSDYSAYKAATSMLLLLPPRKSTSSQDEQDA